MKQRSYLSILFPYFVALPLAITLLVVGGSFFFYSQVNSSFLIKADSYAKWQAATEQKKHYASNAAKVDAGTAYFKQISQDEGASIQSYLAENATEARGLRLVSMLSTEPNQSIKDYSSAFSISLQGHTGDVFSLLVSLQNRYPNAEFSNAQIAPASSGSLVQLSATLSLIKLQ